MVHHLDNQMVIQMVQVKVLPMVHQSDLDLVEELVPN
jgi:hypothetical protein